MKEARKYSEEIFWNEVVSKHGNRYELVSRYKNSVSPILVKDKYGVLLIKPAICLIKNTPGIGAALNKTQYFMNMLNDKHPEIAKTVSPLEEFSGMNRKMLFQYKYGIVKIYPVNLLSGHVPTIRSAINRKSYYEMQLREIYGDKYKWNITSTDRHSGTVQLICPIHGVQHVDTDAVFLGSGCPCCNKGWQKSDLFYIIRLYDEDENFYKLGISHYDSKGNVQRFKDYKELGYNIEVVKIIKFQSLIEVRNCELELKRLIKYNLYVPKRWPYPTSTECFSNNLLDLILNTASQYDIISTSMETQSSDSGEELANLPEDNAV